MTKKSAAKVAARARKAEHGGKYEAHLRLVGGGTSRTKPWTCDKCKQPIASGGGYVLVMDTKTHGYPIRRTPEEAQLKPEAIEKRRAEGRPTEPPWEGVFLGEIDFKPNEISFAAYHKKCDPDGETNPYWISVERAETLEEWCAWVCHLCEKNWMGTSDLRTMIGFWFKNRGKDLPET
jgi:ribosomal protein L37AE/L43A